MNNAKHTIDQNDELRNSAGRSLDDLFAKARSEAEYLETESARQSMLSNVMDRTPSTPVTLGSPVGHEPKRYSKKGITIMTSTALVAAAIVAIGLLNSTPETPITQTAPSISAAEGKIIRPQASNQTAFASANASSKTSNAVRIALPALAQTIPDKPLPVTRDSGWLAPVNLEGIRPTEATPDALKKLGIRFDDNCNALVYFRTANNGPIVVHSFAPKAGFSMITRNSSATTTTTTTTIGESGNNSAPSNESWGADTAGLTISGSTPRMVTNADGAKRFFLLKGGVQIKGLKSDLLGINDSSNGMKMSGSVMISNSPIPGDDGRQLKAVRKTMILVDSSKHGNGIPAADARHISAFTIDSAMSPADEAQLRNRFGIKKGEHKQITINLTTAGESRAGIDSVGIAAMKSMGLSDVEISNLMQGKGDSAMIAHYASKFGSPLNGTEHGKLDGFVNNLLDQVMNSGPDINTLVPVLVKNPSNASCDNSLIFWYDPSEQTMSSFDKTNHTTASITPSSKSSGALKSMNLYPNPVSSSATVNFELGSSRSVSFGVYSLLGHKVLDAGQIADQAPGANTHKIDLSSLSAGVYLLVAVTDQGEQMMQRIVVEK